MGSITAPWEHFNEWKKINSEGEKGMIKNIEFIKNWRVKVGFDFPLMLDCYMALNLEYTVMLAQRAASYNQTRIEEPLMPDEYTAHSKLANKLQGIGSDSEAHWIRK